MKLVRRYGRFAAAFNSLLALLLGLVAAHAQTTPPAPPLKLAMLGDSLTAGYGVSTEQSLPVRLEAALKAEGRNVTILNDGVSGDTSAGGLDRVDWILGDKPDIVLLELGANDALRGIDPASTEKNLAAIVEKIKAAGIPVWIIGIMAPRNLGPDYVDAFDGIYKRLADKYQTPLYPFLLDGVATDPALSQADGLHPNPKGVEVIVQHMLPFMNKTLDDHAAFVHRPARP